MGPVLLGRAPIARAPERAGELLGTALAFRAAVITASAIPVGLLTLALGYGVRTTWLFVLLFLASSSLVRGEWLRDGVPGG